MSKKNNKSSYNNNRSGCKSSSSSYKNSNSSYSGKPGSRRNRNLVLVVLILVCCLCFAAIKYREVRNRDSGAAGRQQSTTVETGPAAADGETGDVPAVDADNLPEYDGHHYVTVNGNVPVFPDDVTAKAHDASGRLTPYEYYGSLDELGRCTAAYGCLGEETMPLEGQDRGDISLLHPSGCWREEMWRFCSMNLSVH